MAENTKTPTPTPTPTQAQTPAKRESALQSRRQFIQNCRNSRIIQKANFTDAVMRIYRLRFREISRAAYLTRFYCAIDRSQNFEVEQIITQEMAAIIDEVKGNIDKKITVADQLIKKHGIKVGKAQYEDVDVTIIDPIAKRFLNALHSARDLDEKLRVLWLDCKLTDTEKRQAINDIEKEFTDAQQRCQALMVGVRNRFNEQRRARDEAGSNAADELAVSETEIIKAVESAADAPAETDSEIEA